MYYYQQHRADQEGPKTAPRNTKLCQHSARSRTVGGRRTRGQVEPPRNCERGRPDDVIEDKEGGGSCGR